MGRGLRTAILIGVLIGCGGGHPNSPQDGFANQTRHTDAELWTIWKAAQDGVVRQVNLNPLERSLHDVPARVLPGDGRATAVHPHQILVAPEPDVPSSLLLAATGVYRADPTGLIACPPPCNVHYAPAYSRYQRSGVKYAASWEFRGDNFFTILEYEFESQILFALGYDVKWR